MDVILRLPSLAGILIGFGERVCGGAQSQPQPRQRERGIGRAEYQTLVMKLG